MVRNISMSSNKRQLLITIFLLGILGISVIFTNLTNINISNTKKNLVIISLRGGMDGLTAVPVNDILINKYRSDLILNNKLKLNSN